MRLATRTVIDRRTGKAKSVSVPVWTEALDELKADSRKPTEKPRQAIEAEEKRDRIIAAADEARMQDIRPGFGAPGKAVLEPAPLPRTSPRDALRTRSGACAKRKAGNSNGYVDLSTVTRKAPVKREYDSSPEADRMRALLVKLTDATMHLYPSECGSLRAEVKELASYFRHDVEKLATLHRLDERLKRVQYSVH